MSEGERKAFETITLFSFGVATFLIGFLFGKIFSATTVLLIAILMLWIGFFIASKEQKKREKHEV